jgi:hypothetical protein
VDILWRSGSAVGGVQVADMRVEPPIMRGGEHRSHGLNPPNGRPFQPEARRRGNHPAGRCGDVPVIKDVLVTGSLRPSARLRVSPCGLFEWTFDGE